AANGCHRMHDGIDHFRAASFTEVRHTFDNSIHLFSTTKRHKRHGVLENCCDSCAFLWLILSGRTIALSRALECVECSCCFPGRCIPSTPSSRRPAPSSEP